MTEYQVISLTISGAGFILGLVNTTIALLRYFADKKRDNDKKK